MQMGISLNKVEENTIVLLSETSSIRTKIIERRSKFIWLTITIRDLNTLVMDFLVKEGYPAAAARFAEEANIPLKEDDAEMPQRVIIKNAIYRGDIQTAIEEINELSPQVRPNSATIYSYMMISVFHAPLIVFRGFDDSNHLTSVLSLITFLPSSPTVSFCPLQSLTQFLDIGW